MIDPNGPTRPPVRWHGGKWMLAPWITSFFGEHRSYVEPYGGGASVLLRKRRSYTEIYNDLDEEAVVLFRVMRDKRRAWRLVRALRLTPFAREEFEEAYRPTRDTVEIARRLIIRSFQGFGSDGHNMQQRTGFRASSARSGTSPAKDWANFPEALVMCVERLRGVTIEKRPAMQVMRDHDGVDTLHYVDPPYLPDTRSQKSRRGGLQYHAYKHEMSAADHAELLAFLMTLEGMVVLSAYPSDLYSNTLTGWTCFTKNALADGARKRIECLWLNPAAVAALPTPSLLDHSKSSSSDASALNVAMRIDTSISATGNI